MHFKEYIGIRSFYSRSRFNRRHLNLTHDYLVLECRKPEDAVSCAGCPQPPLSLKSVNFYHEINEIGLICSKIEKKPTSAEQSWAVQCGEVSPATKRVISWINIDMRGSNTHTALHRYYRRFLFREIMASFPGRGRSKVMVVGLP
jgi:hypothetical protein